MAGKQFWLGPARAGQVITFWADVNVIHLLVGGVRLKSLRSHLSTNDLARLFAGGGRPAGPSPVPERSPITVQRRANAFGVIMVTRQTVSLGRLHAGQVVTVHVSDTAGAGPGRRTGHRCCR